MVFATAYGRYRGGKGYNQAVALARLGASVTMVGAVGDDDFGHDLLDALAREDIDSTRVAVRDDTPTAVAVPLITPDGDVGFAHHRGANATVTVADVADLPDSDVLVLQGEIPMAANLAAARQASERGMTVQLNPAPVTEVPQALAALADVLVPNELEAATLLGLDPDQALDGRAAAQRLAGGERAAVVTMGARGAAWAAGGRGGVVEPPRVEARDATAAGDSFCAALAVRLASGSDWPEAVAYACAAGAHAVTVAGAEPSLPSAADVQRLLQRT